MMAVVTTGNGGYDKLEYKTVPTPVPGPEEVLLQVLAAGMNNTEINTRLGWYSKTVTSSTETLEQADGNLEGAGGWSGATPFPLIQGTDCCGRVVQLGAAVSEELLGRRALVRSCNRTKSFKEWDSAWMASDYDGAFAQFVKVRASEVFPVSDACTWSHVELGSIPCAYGTAEGLLTRAEVCESDHVLITGASGGVASAAIQLAKARGATVTALTSKGKVDEVLAVGPDQVFGARHGEEQWGAAMRELKDTVTVVVDQVGGAGFADVLDTLKTGGRYVSAGAISGPMVQLDLRTLYLRDLKILGETCWDEPVFPNLIRLIEADQIRPLVAKSFPLEDIVEAQTEFLLKQHVGKFVLIPEFIEPPELEVAAAAEDTSLEP